jgi:hypothetical protein
LGDSNPISISVNKDIIDTGTSYVVVPTPEFEAIIAYFSKLMLCAEDQLHGLYQCQCEYEQWMTLFPPINITLSQANTYQMPRDEYVLRW